MGSGAFCRVYSLSRSLNSLLRSRAPNCFLSSPPDHRIYTQSVQILPNRARLAQCRACAGPTTLSSAHMPLVFV